MKMLSWLKRQGSDETRSGLGLPPGQREACHAEKGLSRDDNGFSYEQQSTAFD